MSRVFLAGTFAVLLGLTLWAHRLKSDPVDPMEVTLRWTTEYSAERQAQAEFFNDTHPGIRIVLDLNYGGLDKILVQAASGVGPDLADYYGPGELQTLAETGIAAPLASTPVTWPGAEAYVRYDGVARGSPVMLWGDILYFNEAVFDSLGVRVPRAVLSWDEFFRLAETLRVAAVARKRDVIPLVGFRWQPWQALHASRRGEYFTADGTELTLQDNAMVETLRQHQRAIHERRCVLSGLALRSLSAQPDAPSLFIEGRFAMMVGAVWQLKWFNRYRQSLSVAARGQLKISALPLPFFAGSEPAYLVQGRGMAVNALSKKRDAAALVLAHLGTAAHGDLINRQMDGMPPNPKSADAHWASTHPEIGGPSAYAASVFALRHGYTRRQSPFYLTTDVERILYEKLEILESDPAANPRELMAAATRELDQMRDRRLHLDPALRAKFERARAARKVDP